MPGQTNLPLNEEQMTFPKSFRYGTKIAVAPHGIGYFFLFQKFTDTVCQDKAMLHQSAGGGINIHQDDGGTVGGEIVLTYNQTA